MENRILSHLGSNNKGYSMVMETGRKGTTFYALYIGAALLDCYPVDDDETEEWLQGKMREYDLH